MFTYTNPVINVGSADPAVIKASDGRYYLYNTFGLSIWVSDDLANWSYAGSASPVGTWGVADFWAPEVIEYEGQFYLFYSAERAQGGKRIGVAKSDRPTGPFRDLGRPLFDFGFPVIDAHPFIASDGSKYLFFAKDQVLSGSGRHESHIYGVRLGDDLMSTVGEPVFLTRPDQLWERRSGDRLWNEGPYVIENDGVFYLMYSANFFGGRDYSVGYATADHPLGPYTKYEGNPILSRGAWTGGVSGPGHHSVVRSPDDKELFIVYHIHADPAVGGGDRRIAIDRLGFREDGSLYVSGPTLTPQPLPSGATELVNLAPFARVASSSVRAGHRASAVVDGEITVDTAKADHEWVAEGAEGWVRLEWDRPQRARWLFLYGSVMASRRPVGATVRLSDGHVISAIEFPEEPGAAAIIELPDDRDFTWLEISIDGRRGFRPEIGLSEIMVLGYPGGLPDSSLGSVWVSSPRRGGTVSDEVPIRVETLNVQVDRVRLELDGEVLYEGEALPQYGAVKPWALDEGQHRLSAFVIDSAGREYRYTSEFSVEHLRLRSPLWGDRVQGDLTLELELLLSDDHVANFEVHLVPIGGISGAEGVSVYSGATVPERLSVSSLDVADGAYDLTTRLVTNSGVVSTQKTRVVVKNWILLDDPIEPPQESGWFGSLPRIKTESMSRGWLYATESPTEFFGDADRIGTAGDSEEYLIWSLPHLHSFELTLYATDTAVDSALAIAVSTDGTKWVAVPHEVTVAETSQGDRFKLMVSGKIPLELDASEFRLTFLPSGLGLDDLQLGHVLLRGVPGGVN